MSVRLCTQCNVPLSAGTPVCPACGAEQPSEAERETYAPTDPPINPPSRIGPYRVLQRIGEGGMGVVYLAEQSAPLRRRVAIKIVRAGMGTREVLARFGAERQALALMDHPCVAQVYDAGELPDGTPYFVMEYVPGLPITEYCDKHRLSVRERLELFTQVCSGIQHAHQKGVVHRDIKPSNVLVSEESGKPLPKIIDFGLAKALHQPLTDKTLFTQLGFIVGTPAYMSPEQAEASGRDVDTTSDVYSLGVVLYELLTGAIPFSKERLLRAGYAEMQRIILEEEPLRPSARLSGLGHAGATIVAIQRHTKLPTLLRQLKGDLDWIAIKAMEKRRTRRYPSASEMAADIERHLNTEAVLARAPSAIYRIETLTRKYRSAIAVIAVGMLISFILPTSALLTTNVINAVAHVQAMSGDTKQEIFIAVDKALRRNPEWPLAESLANDAALRLTLEATSFKVGVSGASVCDLAGRVIASDDPSLLGRACPSGPPLATLRTMSVPEIIRAAAFPRQDMPYVDSSEFNYPDGRPAGHIRVSASSIFIGASVYHVLRQVVQISLGQLAIAAIAVSAATFVIISRQRRVIKGR